MGFLQAGDLHPVDRTRKPFLVVLGIASLLGAGLMVYSQTAAFAWDEGFHLLAAQLIKAGKRPYLDFCFPQTPLNAYWNALWMSVLGETWRVPHAVAALMTAAAALLAADFLLARPLAANWRLASALAAVSMIGANVLVVQFGAIAQAYGLCLFLIVAAFRATILAVHRTNPLWAALAALLACAASASSLLTAPVAAVLLVWLMLYNRAGGRLGKFLAFAAGGLVAFAPVLWLYVNGPRQTLFNIIEYNFRYRELNWEGVTEHNLGVLLSWIDSSHALLLTLLAVAGLLFVRMQRHWSRSRRAEFYLCGWLALALGLHVSIARPTFQRYYLLLVPFLSILGAVGLYAIGSRLAGMGRPWRTFTFFALLLCLGTAKMLYEGLNDDFLWRDAERIAAEVERVTPPHASLLASENVYFLLHRSPPSGMELADSHKFSSLPPDLAALLHIVPRPELDRRVLAREFDTIQECGEEAHILKLDLPKLYVHKTEFDDCAVFWELR